VAYAGAREEQHVRRPISRALRCRRRRHGRRRTIYLYRWRNG
jgi:hypothetical protein